RLEERPAPQKLRSKIHGCLLRGQRERAAEVAKIDELVDLLDTVFAADLHRTSCHFDAFPIRNAQMISCSATGNDEATLEVGGGVRDIDPSVKRRDLAPPLDIDGRFGAGSLLPGSLVVLEKAFRQSLETGGVDLPRL